MVLGYNNRMAVVDLSSKEVDYSQPEQAKLEEYIGGRGLGAVLLKKSFRVEPLSEKSVLIVAVGPLTGSGIPLANRLTFIFRSPQTGTVAWANTGGYAGAELKRAGFDALVIRGKSERPVYLFVHDSSVSVLDATKIWGQGAIDVVTTLRHAHGDVRVLSIGQGGENLVRFANVVNDTGRTSGVRHGVGCVMGSKKLKGIVIKGDPTKRVEMADRAAHLQVVRDAVSKLRQSSLLNHESGLLAVYGTPIAAEYLGKNDALPVMNYKHTVLERYSEIGGRNLSRTILISRLTCSNCPVGCRRETASTGKYGFRVEGPDYSQISALGTNCYVLDLEAIAYMNYLCYDYGIDPIEMGNELAILAELTEEGLVRDGLKWGDVDKMINLVRQTAFREGIGEHLSQGPDKLASHFEAPRMSMSVKGVSVQNTDPRVEPAWGLLNATENFGGAEHIWVYADLIHSLGETGVNPLITVDSTPHEITEAVKYKQNLIAVLDSLQICAFSSYAFSVDDYAKALRNITGQAISSDELLDTGARIFRLERSLNEGNGFDPSYDTLPSRFLEIPVPEGRHKGRVCELEPMLREYRKLSK